MQNGSRAYQRWWSAILVCSTVTLFPGQAVARFASQFSLSVGEEYNDNIFFSEEKTHDFVTVITPALHFIYEPQFRLNSRLTVDMNAPAEIYVRHGEQTNIGDRFSLRTRYYYPYSQNLTFSISDDVCRIGKTRLSGFDESRGSGFGGSSGGGNFLGGITNIGGIGGEDDCGGGGGGRGPAGSREALLDLYRIQTILSQLEIHSPMISISLVIFCILRI